MHFNTVKLSVSQQTIIDEYLMNGYTVISNPCSIGVAIKVLIASYDEKLVLIIGKNGKVYKKQTLMGEY